MCNAMVYSLDNLSVHPDWECCLVRSVSKLSTTIVCHSIGPLNVSWHNSNVLCFQSAAYIPCVSVYSDLQTQSAHSGGVRPIHDAAYFPLSTVMLTWYINIT